MGRERFWLPQADWTALGFWVARRETVALQGPSGSKSLSGSSATLLSAASVEVKKSKSGRPLLSWYLWMASPSETVRSFVAQGCFDLFVGAGKGGNTIESLVLQRSAVRAGSSVDRG